MFSRLLKLVFLLLTSLCTADHSKFVILIASYNNEAYVEKNILSAIDQNYDHFRVIYVDDASTDRTIEILTEVLQRSKKTDLVKIIRNNKNYGAPLPNHYYTIHTEIEDDEVVVLLDGDDCLAHDYVLQHLDTIYSSTQQKIWLTYGQFEGMQSGGKGFCIEYPKKIINSNRFRDFIHMPSHLKTFYAWLFKKIKIEDLMQDGEFFKMAGDLALILPMIEMAKNHFKFIPEVLYLYNESNELSEHRKNFDLQMETARYIRSLNKYSPLD